jgi:hypothetical protein
LIAFDVGAEGVGAHAGVVDASGVALERALACGNVENTSGVLTKSANPYRGVLAARGVDTKRVSTRRSVV